MPRSVAATLPPPAAPRPRAAPPRRAAARAGFAVKRVRPAARARRAVVRRRRGSHYRRADVLRRELSGLELARELGVDLGVGRWRLPARLLLALHLEVAPALE